RYTKRAWGNGYFTTQGGKTYPMSILSKQTNGKYVRGVQGYRNAMNAAKNATKLLKRMGNNIGYLQLALQFRDNIITPNIENKLNFGLGVASLFYWEIGAIDVSTSLYYDCVVRPNVEQIQENIANGLPPTRNVYNPQTGMLDY
ncbi:MAG: hypothetical protein H6Q13_2885, partial [Bacteroidetes bacterium]|nr:hypothetical protein [Bacteroidota bacterium]